MINQPTDRLYNKAYNALDFAHQLKVISCDNVDHLSWRIDTSTTENELNNIISSLAKKIKVNRHKSKKEAVAFLTNAGYQLLKSSDKPNMPLIQYGYQLGKGFYHSVYVVKLQD